MINLIAMQMQINQTSYQRIRTPLNPSYLPTRIVRDDNRRLIAADKKAYQCANSPQHTNQIQSIRAAHYNFVRNKLTHQGAQSRLHQVLLPRECI